MPKSEWKFRQAILKAKVAEIHNHHYCIHHLNDLQKVVPETPIEQKGLVEFQAEAEVFFESKAEECDFQSNGERLKIKGSIEWKNNDWIFIEPLKIDYDYCTNNLKKISNE